MNNPIPWLRKGVGNTPEDGGCIMQVVSWISTMDWFDTPVCVHPTVRDWAIWMNDTVDDDQRQRLLRLIPKMMSTNVRDNRIDMRISGLATWLSGQIPHLDNDNMDINGDLITPFEQFLDKVNEVIGRTPDTEMPDLSGVCAAMQPA